MYICTFVYIFKYEWEDKYVLDCVLYVYLYFSNYFLLNTVPITFSKLKST